MLPTFVSGNPNKVHHLSRMLGYALPHKNLDVDEIQSPDPREVIAHKVNQAYEQLKRPVLVEDTSLHFNALDGLPGPFIKFFVGVDNGLEKLCRMLDGFEDRSAYGKVIYGYRDADRTLFFDGRLDGFIADHPRGSNGYGWSSIFEPVGYGGLTRAEMDDEQGLETYKMLRDIEGLKAFLEQCTRDGDC